MNTCGECQSYLEGKCLMSGFLGCKEEDLLKVKKDELACESFAEMD